MATQIRAVRVASGLSKEDEERQASTLLYCLGEEADDVLTSTNISTEDRKKYKQVLAKFDAHFKVRKNIIFERARFNRRMQEEEESVEQFITSLYSLADNCEYGNMKEELIRDRLVVGIKDVTLSERLQMDEALTLDKAKKSVRQREAVKEQQSFLKREETSLDYVKSKDNSSRPHKRTQQPPPANKCIRCGKGRHTRQNCPARDSTCYKCGKQGHFSTVCLSKTIANISEDPTETEPIETSYLNVMTNNHQATTSWNIQVKVNGKAVMFVIDTGAEVSAISRNVYEAIGQPRLYNPNKILCGPGRQVLNVLGCCTVKLSYKQHRVSQKVYVVHKLANNLLGLPAIIALNVLTQVNAVQRVDHPIADKFPDLFHGLGTMKDEYEIKLKPDAKPYSLFSARRVPIPMREKVKTELQQMEAAGVISKVDGPTSWCAGMVVVPKKSGEVRICVDLKPLNENVLRETHPMPHVDDALAQLSGAKLFSRFTQFTHMFTQFTHSSQAGSHSSHTVHTHACSRSSHTVHRHVHTQVHTVHTRSHPCSHTVHTQFPHRFTHRFTSSHTVHTQVHTVHTQVNTVHTQVHTQFTSRFTWFTHRFTQFTHSSYAG